MGRNWWEWFSTFPSLSRVRRELTSLCRQFQRDEGSLLSCFLLSSLADSARCNRLNDDSSINPSILEHLRVDAMKSL